MRSDTSYPLWVLSLTVVLLVPLTLSQLQKIVVTKDQESLVIHGKYSKNYEANEDDENVCVHLEQRIVELEEMLANVTAMAESKVAVAKAKAAAEVRDRMNAANSSNGAVSDSITMILEKKMNQTTPSYVHSTSEDSEFHPHLLHIMPDDPDPTIGEWLRSIIITKHAKDAGTRTAALNNSTSIQHGKRATSSAEDSSPLSKCSPTSQIKIYAQGDNPEHATSHMTHTTKSNNHTWILKTMDEEGREKSIGGDEFYITYRDQTNNGLPDTAVAMITDNHDGTYTLDFVGPPYGVRLPLSKITGLGSLKVSLLFTCGIGRMTRPTKDYWKTGGHLYHDHYTYVIANASAPHIRQLSLPNISPVDGTKIIDLSKHDKVICYGDSQLLNFCGTVKEKYIFRKDNLFPSPNVGDKVQRDRLQIALNTLDEIWGADLNRTVSINMNVTDEDGHSPPTFTNSSTNANTITNTNTPTTTALILNSAVWDIGSNRGPIEDHYFNDTIQMYSNYVKAVRARYPHVALYWKSPTALHPTMVKEDSCYKRKQCVNRVRYLSLSSTEYLYVEQKRIMKELNVTFMDLWEVSYGADTWHRNGDSIHHQTKFNMYLNDFFYPDSMAFLN